jgi:Fur family ferric uptake transcriptional regulator
MIASTQTNSPLAGDRKPTPPQASPVDLAIDRLRAAGLRVTQPRVAILAALCAHEGPISIEQIHRDVGAAKCDLVTVYRCMAAFEKIGIVNRAFFHNGTALFKVTLDRPSPFYVVCKSSNRVEAIDPATSAELRKAITFVQEKLVAKGYTDVGHIVEFFGHAPSRARHSAPAVPVSD